MLRRFPIAEPTSFSRKRNEIRFQDIGINKQIIKWEFARAIVGRGHDPADPVPVFDLVC